MFILPRVLVVDHVLQEVLLDVPPVLEPFNEKPFMALLSAKQRTLDGRAKTKLKPTPQAKTYENIKFQKKTYTIYIHVYFYLFLSN